MKTIGPRVRVRELWHEFLLEWPLKTFTSLLISLSRFLLTEWLLVRVTRSSGPLLIMMLDIHVKEGRLELSPLIRICQIDYAKVLRSWMF